MNPHKKYRTYKTIIKSIENKDSAIIICNELLDYTFEIDKYEPTDNKNYSLNPTSTLLKCTDRPFGLWYEKNIGSFKNYKGISYSCIVAVHKNDILKFPLSYYQNLIKYLENVENTECGHFFERSWANIFDLDEKNIYRCDLLDYIYYSMCY
jgi:hypothetical protein